MVEAAVVVHSSVECALACMTERRVTEVVHHRHDLGQIHVEAQCCWGIVRAIWATSRVWVRRVR